MKISKYVPALSWMRNYQKKDLPGDIIAGLTITIMLIPQGMAYAMLAGLPPIIGLYSSFIPLFVYAFLGTSRQLAVGPVAMDSLLVASSVGAMAAAKSEEYMLLAILLALMVGLVQLVMGIVKLGFLVNFLSEPVIKGFTAAAALIIGLSQLKHLLGITIPSTNYIHEIILTALRKSHEINLPTLLIGFGSIFLLYILKKWKPAFPGALVTIMITTLLVWLLSLEQSGVSIVGSVPNGIPSPRLPRLNFSDIETLFPTALTIAIVAIMEAISVGKTFAAKNKYTIDANQELRALGMANIAGSFFMSYPVTGGFSRTAVNAQAGARTPLASIITATMIGLTLLFLTPLFYYLPKAILAAIIMVAVFGLIDIKGAIAIFKLKKADGYILLITFLATLTLGIQQGILVGIVISLLVFINNTSKPHIAVLGKVPGTEMYRNISRYQGAILYPGITIFRIDSSLYFANVNFIRDKIMEMVEQDPTLNTIIIEGNGINQFDSSAAEFLHQLHDTIKSKDIKIIFSSLKGPVRDIIIKSGLYERFGAENFFDSLPAALEQIMKNNRKEVLLSNEK